MGLNYENKHIFGTRRKNESIFSVTIFWSKIYVCFCVSSEITQEKISEKVFFEFGAKVVIRK